MHLAGDDGVRGVDVGADAGALADAQVALGPQAALNDALDEDVAGARKITFEFDGSGDYGFGLVARFTDRHSGLLLEHRSNGSEDPRAPPNHQHE